MNSSFVIILLSFAILIAYVVYSLVTLKVIPESLSETYYRLNYKMKGLGRLFPITMFICAATLLPIWLDYSKDNFQWLVFLACSATFFVAVTPNYYEGLERQVHYGAAVVCCVSAILWTMLSGTWLIPIINFAFALGYMVLYNRKKQIVFIIEIATLFSVYISLLLQ